MSEWVVSHLGSDVPMHFSRFKPTYRLKNLPSTPVSTVDRCRRIALDAGVHFVYVGNVPTHEGESTYCHHCGERLIHRVGWRVELGKIKDGKCLACDTRIPGIWSQQQALRCT